MRRGWGPAEPDPLLRSASHDHRTVHGVPRAGAAGPVPEAAATPEEFAELLPQTRRALLRRLAAGQAEGRAPSMTGAVVRGGRAVWTAGRGSVEGEVPHGDVQYRIGSLTKTFVAVLVLRLRDEGLLSLEDPVGRHLDGTPVPDATIAQLLAHSSGLAAEARGPWWERTAGTLRPEPADLFGERPRRLPAGRRHRTPTPAMHCSARWSNGCEAVPRGTRYCGTRCWNRWAWGVRRCTRRGRTRVAGRSTRGPTSCCPNRPRTPG